MYNVHVAKHQACSTKNEKIQHSNEFTYLVQFLLCIERYNNNGKNAKDNAHNNGNNCNYPTITTGSTIGQTAGRSSKETEKNSAR